MDISVRNNEAQGRYELLMGDRLIGIADYRVEGDVVVFPHTEITPSLRGQGYGEQLVRGALDDVAQSGRSVRPVCWFVREFIDAHPDYRQLRAA